MIIPSWVMFLVATWVLAFGAYRLSIVWRRFRQTPNPRRPQFQTKGLWGQTSRRHILFGALYLILGAYLVAMGLGYASNLQRLFGIGSAETPEAVTPNAEPGSVTPKTVTPKTVTPKPEPETTEPPETP